MENERSEKLYDLFIEKIRGMAVMNAFDLMEDFKDK